MSRVAEMNDSAMSMAAAVTEESSARLFVRWLKQVHPDTPEHLLSVAEQLVNALSEGHACLSRDELARRCELDIGMVDACLQPSAVVGDEHSLCLIRCDDRQRVYIARYHELEGHVAQVIRERLTPVDDAMLDREQLRSDLGVLFSSSTTGQTDWQALAAATAALKKFSVISGGPGTGKTTTVSRVLWLLRHQPGGAQSRMALAAPTGKAAQRLSESMAAALERLPEVRAGHQALPSDAQTLHRLLGLGADGIHARYHRGRRLPLDLLVIDEASMVDLALMSRVLEALPDHARLILLGDRDQLASVDVGNVLAELCAQTGFSPAHAQALAALGLSVPPVEVSPVSALGDHVVVLQHSHRFASGGGVGQLAVALRDGDLSALESLLQADAESGLRHEARAVAGNEAALQKWLLQGYDDYLQSVSAQEDFGKVFAAFAGFRALAAHREGASGVAGINDLMEQGIRRLRRLSALPLWYPGRPVMITRNDYRERLFNGDIGLTLLTPEGVKVVFPDGDGFRSLPPARLPPHETAWAMTVHKSQGSEFEEVLLVLPDDVSPALNRALLYTGVTRAKERVALWGRWSVLEAGVQQLTQRFSGLFERIVKDC